MSASFVMTPPATIPSRSAAESAGLPKSYSPAESEGEIRAGWDAANAFHADPTSGEGEPFCILIPPPNVTAALHLGHAFNNTLQDVLVRYHRMKGFKTLWMPGTDHAGISTQAVVEKRLLLQGKRRSDFTREQFIARVQEWKDEYEATIIEQLKVMGCSCDFDRTRFTMDQVCAKAVREAFFRLFKDGLIYRGKRLVNWDPVTQTALADDEVEMEEVRGNMWYLRYPLEPQAGAERSTAPGDASKFITVATTRPETMLGDTAVAINPKDPRAAQLVGKFIKLPIVNRIIPIIADDYVVRPVQYGGDPSDAKAAVATGFLKVTPAHDPNDEAIWQRHKDEMPLGQLNIFAPNATISLDHGWAAAEPAAKDNPDVKPLIGLSREDARKKVVQWIKDHNLLEDVKPYTHSVGHSYRSHVPIEPYLSDQWYVKVTDDRLKGEALRAMAREQFDECGDSLRAGASPPPGDARVVDRAQPGAEDGPARESLAGGLRNGDGELRFFPARYAKTFQQWHENLRDWCISRQLWWGHRIPVWHKRVTLTEANWTTELLGWGWDSFVEGNWREEGIEVCIIRVEDRSVIDPSSDPLMPVVKETEGEYDIFICMRNEVSSLKSEIENQKFQRDPDVLDTWFSSGLWPLSTMGWPAPGSFPDEIPEGEALLNTFNPSTTLCTAREIITLWVSRMVMFNRYLTADDPDPSRRHRLPFKKVYIHAMIQDGHGQKMSKSLGNGVDPRDIIHSHGADAMRFILTQIATATQDVRLPVDMICPHCGETVHPNEITISGGYRVAEAEQTCGACKKKMVSGYGAASGLATPSKETPLARNTSSRFDQGRNFANKLWNATRFALSNLEASRDQGIKASSDALSLVDKWIIARLHRTLHIVEDAIADYQFNAYADAMYDLIWRDFCDWYLEAIKPTVKSNPGQQQVLRTMLNAILRLLHPIMPFVTETLWPHAANSGGGLAGMDGINLPPSDLLVKAAWPEIQCSVEDEQAVVTFERIQSLVEAIRTIKTERNAQKKRITLHAPRSVLDLINSAGGVVEALAGVESIAEIPGSRSAGVIPLAFEGQELLLGGLVEQIDAGAERARLMKLIEEKERAVTGFTGRLNNAGYVSKAPPEKVEETRQLLAQAEADLAAARRALQSLD